MVITDCSIGVSLFCISPSKGWVIAQVRHIPRYDSGFFWCLLAPLYIGGGSTVSKLTRTPGRGRGIDFHCVYWFSYRNRCKSLLGSRSGSWRGGQDEGAEEADEETRMRVQRKLTRKPGQMSGGGMRWGEQDISRNLDENDLHMHREEKRFHADWRRMRCLCWERVEDVSR